MPILVYYSVAPTKDNLKTYCQFYYTGTTTFEQDENDMLVINGDCYGVDVTWGLEGDIATASVDGQAIFNIDFSRVSVSQQYRAERYVRSQITEFDSLLNRYVNLYKYNNQDLYGYQATEYNDALVVANIFSNASNFANVNGWVGDDLYFRLFPALENIGQQGYNPKSYLYFTPGYKFNTGLQNNRSYLENGLVPGDKFIFRIKAYKADGGPGNFVDKNNIHFNIIGRNLDYEPSGENYLSVSYMPSESIDWLAYECTCIKACSKSELLSTSNPLGFFIQYTDSNGTPCWVEEVQFFKKVVGLDATTGDEILIYPNAIDTQSIATPVWRYYLKNARPTSLDDLEYLYISTEEWDQARPVYNNFEKMLLQRQVNLIVLIFYKQLPKHFSAG